MPRSDNRPPSPFDDAPAIGSPDGDGQGRSMAVFLSIYLAVVVVFGAALAQLVSIAAG